MSVVEFGELPEARAVSKSRRTKNVEIAEALRARPGEWALITPGLPSLKASSVASGFRRSSVFTPHDAFEFAQRRDPETEGVSDVWARFVGASA